METIKTNTMTIERIEEIKDQIINLCEQLHTFVNENDSESFEDEFSEIEDLKETLKRFSNDEWAY